VLDLSRQRSSSKIISSRNRRLWTRGSVLSDSTGFQPLNQTDMEFWMERHSAAHSSAALGFKPPPVAHHSSDPDREELGSVTVSGSLDRSITTSDTTTWSTAARSI